MLLEISIKTLPLLRRFPSILKKGMTVLTGETGAGKSIIIDAMNLMLGLVQRQTLFVTVRQRQR